jgi:hypothetical protein
MHSSAEKFILSGKQKSLLVFLISHVLYRAAVTEA